MTTFYTGIHSKCGFFGFMIRFWILVKKNAKSVLDSRIQIWILPKKRTLFGDEIVAIFVHGHPCPTKV